MDDKNGRLDKKIYYLAFFALIMVCGIWYSGQREKLMLAGGREVLGGDGGVSVYVCGEVKTPGVYPMRGTDRVEDAITAAGGLTETADISGLNLAEYVLDGGKIHIPAAGGEPLSAEAPAEAAGPDYIININEDGAYKLVLLPGIGEAIAGRIIAYREENGPFGSIEEIKEVSGIGDKVYDKIKEYITIE